MNTRTVLIHNYAKKNKSRRKKYFVLSICKNYSEPRLDYFISQDKWNQKKHEVYNNNTNPEDVSYQSIDLSNLFFIDNLHRTKPKLLGLNLYMEDRHLMLTLPTEELKKKWREYFENIIYKNSKLKSYCKIEHVLEVTIRVKPKENIDKSVYSQLRGSFRACFTKSFLIFVNKSFEKPAFTIQYPFIRQWESRFDGTFRLEIGRASLIGECVLILQLADYEDSKAAHAMLTNCIMSFKLSKPEPPKIRNSFEKPSKRNTFSSYLKSSNSFTTNTNPIAKRRESCITFGTEYDQDANIKTNPSVQLDAANTNDDNYLPMNDPSVVDASPCKSQNVIDYFEHTNRVYKCPKCGFFTKLIIYCSRCCNTVNRQSLSMLCKSESNSDRISAELQRHLCEPRTKTQSLTEKPIRFPTSNYRTRQFLSETAKQTASVTSKSSSKASTNESSSKQESQTSLSISANRHDDDIFVELDFDKLDTRITTSNIKTPFGGARQQCQLKCANCLINLIHKSPGENLIDKRCSTCFEELVTLTIPLKDSVIGSDWRPRTTSLLPTVRSTAVSDFNPSNCPSEYVDVKPDDIMTIKWVCFGLDSSVLVRHF